MVTLNNCNTATLTPFIPTAITPWNIARVRQVTRRLGFGVTYAEEQAALAIQPGMFVDNWINDSVAIPPTPAPAWGYWTINDYSDYQSQRQQQYRDWYVQVLNDLSTQKLKGRMTLFWHNHLVTQLSTYQAPSWLFQYYNLLQVHALGNFKSLIKDMGKNEAMLRFLDGYRNRRTSPNENYARELFELFTLGENNGYTQQDIVEASRALTGYTTTVVTGGDIIFNPNTFDNTNKTIFGTTANFNHDSLIDHLFAVRATEISQHIVKKIYRNFVSPELPAAGIIDQLALTFRNANWEILPVLQQLFKSAHFFNGAACGNIVKSPLDTLLGFKNETGFPLTSAEMLTVHYIASTLGQEMFQPIDVAGWPGDRDWINSSTLTGRWQGCEYIMYLAYNINPQLFRNIATSVATSTIDVALIARQITDRFLPDGLYTAADYNVATQVFKAEIPQNYYDTGQWNLNWSSIPYQVSLLLQHIMRMPEFELK